MQRRVSSRGWTAIAGQRIGVGIAHAGTTVIFEEADATFRITRAGQVVSEVARTTTEPIARFKVRRPQKTTWVGERDDPSPLLRTAEPPVQMGWTGRTAGP
ncbi:hypothetical protein ACIBCT_19770 [Streptosporangium sp. NPDC050855]|uniref:hypothetical protein n=1 Tax=Streptosporangium sp. NPDC050855 TaxID=3366194 RepID=UPI00378DF326